MEYDFNIRYPSWSGMDRVKAGKVSLVIRAERQPFEPGSEKDIKVFTAFLNSYLWGIEQADLDLHPIKERAIS